MHTSPRKQRKRRVDMLSRLGIVVTLLILLLPFSTLELLGVVDRGALEESLQSIVRDASDRYSRTPGLRMVQSQSERIAGRAESEVLRIGKQRSAVRSEIVALRGVLTDLQRNYGIHLSEGQHAAPLIERERDAITAFLRYLYARGLLGNRAETLRDQVRRSLVLGAPGDERIALRSLAAARARLFAFLVSANEVPLRIAELEERHVELSREYRSVLGTYEQASSTARVSAAQQEEIQRTMAEVHGQVLRLQGELQRIDARIARRAERALIDKGLMDPRPGVHADGAVPASAVGFSWPVTGSVSAGFRSASYERYFGVPHHGMDIVVGMGAPVRSAADGVVFLVRDGGEKGYSYVLIGHRGGYATLYGHLSRFAVGNGQDVSQGQVIGYSGGDPGSSGAGPMTTGAHLHFEVILSGVNVDPASVLP